MHSRTPMAESMEF